MTHSTSIRVTSSVAVLAILLSGCTTGQANTTPPVTSGGGGGQSNSVLQVRMGTVNFSGLGVGVNVLETYRDANGFTAIPITTATLMGPPGFRGPSGSKDPGSGAKGAIPIGSASNQFVIGTAGSSTVLAGADGWGIGPPSCSCAGINFYPFQPQFADATLGTVFSGGAEPFYGGPPAYPPTTLVASSLSSLVNIPSGWAEGFYFMGFKKLPPSGTYRLKASYQQNGKTLEQVASTTFDASPMLPSMFGQPAVRSDGKGGLIVTVHFKPGIKQAIVNVIDAYVPPAPPPSGGTACTTGLGFASLLFTKSGTQKIPDNLGNYGQGGAPTFCKGDLLNVQLIAFDYDDFDLGPPGNSQQTPPLPARADATYASTIIFE